MGKNRTNKKSNQGNPEIYNNPSFINHVEEWSEGYGEYEEIFTQEERTYIRTHLSTTQDPLYRIVELDTHIEDGKRIIDNNPLNYKVGDTINFHGEMKSFSKSEDAILEFGADTTTPLVIYKTRGVVENFPIDNYPHNYQWLQETLVSGSGWKVESVSDLTKIEKYKLHHSIGGNSWSEERPIFMVEISRT